MGTERFPQLVRSSLDKLRTECGRAVQRRRRNRPVTHRGLGAEGTCKPLARAIEGYRKGSRKPSKSVPATHLQRVTGVSVTDAAGLHHLLNFEEMPVNSSRGTRNRETSRAFANGGASPGTGVDCPWDSAGTALGHFGDWGGAAPADAALNLRRLGMGALWDFPYRDYLGFKRAVRAMGLRRCRTPTWKARLSHFQPMQDLPLRRRLSRS